MPASRIPCTLSLFLAACSFHPDWVHKLPDEAPAVWLEDETTLPGIYERPVYSRFGIANKRARSGGRESIEISYGEADVLRYRKVHTHTEVIDGHVRFQLYHEEGTVEIKLPFALLIPETAEYGEIKRPEPSPLETAWANVQRSRAESVVTDLEKVRAAPLLYYYYGTNLLIPLIYERSGRTYDYGLFEGTTTPYDTTSTAFRETLRKYARKEFREHAYWKVRERSRDTYAHTDEPP